MTYNAQLVLQAETVRDQLTFRLTEFFEIYGAFILVAHSKAHVIFSFYMYTY